MHKVTITKIVNGATVKIEAEGNEPFYIVDHKISMIEKLLDSHIYSEEQGAAIIKKMSKAELESDEGKLMYKDIMEMSFPVKIPKALSHFYNDERPF